MKVTFPDGEFYDCGDPESLTHTDPAEAVEAYLDDDLNPGMSVAGLITCIRARPITVTAYRPTNITDQQITRWADSLLESLGEHWCEFCDPDDDPCDSFPDDAAQTMRDAVARILRRSRVWSCESVGSVTLTPDQIEALMREHRPEWFQEPTP